MDPKTQEFDFKDKSLTENTRVGYPINYISNAQIPGVGGIPSVVIFLTADAFGVLPPISRLDKKCCNVSFYNRIYIKACRNRKRSYRASANILTCFGETFYAFKSSCLCRNVR